jgi:general secretion pathway protein D
MDQPEPEVMLEVDVIEVSRERTLALGINLPTSFGVSIPDMTLEAFKKLTDSQATVSGMKVGITAQKTDADGNTLATPRIRVRNKEKAKFLVGDRLPVISSAATPSSAGGASVYNTTVQYVEVGIKIEAEPTIYADGEVAIKLTLEVSSASSPNADAAKSGTIAYSIGTRSLNTVLRLKDGQTEIIGGLIQDNDTSDATRVPGLGDIPILGRLFGVQTDVKKKKEVIMSITPRIVRNNRQVDSELLEMWSGTENNMRFGTRQVGNAKLQAPGDAAAAGGLVSMAPASGFAAPATTAAPAPALAAAPATSTAPAAAAPAATADAAAVPGAPRPLPRAMPPAAANPALNRALPATPPGAPGAAAAAVPAPRAATALAAVPAPRAASVAAPAALRPFTLSAPANAKVGDKIMVSLAFPPSVGSTQLEATLSYDSSRLKLLVVNEADAARNRGAALRFTGDGDSAGSVRVELVAGRGETLPASGGALAQVQFEVLAGTGTTPISVDSGTLVNDIGSTKLPATPSAEIDVK